MRLQHVQGGGRGDRFDSRTETAGPTGEPRGAEPGPLQLHSVPVPGSASPPGPVSREDPRVPVVDHQRRRVSGERQAQRVQVPVYHHVREDV